MLGRGRPDAAELTSDIDTAVTITNDFWTRHWSEYFTGSYAPPRVTGAYGPPYMAQGARVGDSWVYLIIAHEWGHAVQYRLSAELETRTAELQADCLAGATLYGAVADDTPWTREGDHGDTFERIGAFGTGRTGGVQACLPDATG